MTAVRDGLVAALADRYRIERELGAGGMATVYLAHDLKHDRKVAIKVLKPELAAVLGAERFVVEIKTTATAAPRRARPRDDGVRRYREGHPISRRLRAGLRHQWTLMAQRRASNVHARRHGALARPQRDQPFPPDAPARFLLHRAEPGDVGARHPVRARRRARRGHPRHACGDVDLAPMGRLQAGKLVGSTATPSTTSTPRFDSTRSNTRVTRCRTRGSTPRGPRSACPLRFAAMRRTERRTQPHDTTQAG